MIFQKPRRSKTFCNFSTEFVEGSGISIEWSCSFQDLFLMSAKPSSTLSAFRGSLMFLEGSL